jgi:hypothetical protein
VESLLLLLFVVHVPVVALLAVHAAARSGRLRYGLTGPPAVSAAPLGTTGEAGPTGSVARGFGVPEGRTLEEYVQAGLVDLRIMLVQAARRRPL